MTKYKLTYFDAKGLAEICRLIFAAARVEYEDNRIPLGSLTEEMRAEIRLTWPGVLPTLEIDGMKFSQSFAIARYLARKYDLVGETDLEDLRIDEYVEQMKDYFFTRYIPLHFPTTPEVQKNELREQMLLQNPKQMQWYTLILNEQRLKWNSSWLVGLKMTWADICLAHCTESFERSIAPDLTKEFPIIQEHRRRVFNSDGIKEWVQRRPETKF